MCDKSLIGNDTPNPYTKSLYDLEAAGTAVSADSSFAAFLNKLTGTSVISEGAIIEKTEVIAPIITATSALTTNGTFQTSSLIMESSTITSSNNAGISITPYSGSSIILNDQTIMNGVATVNGIFRVGPNPFLFEVNPSTNKIYVNVPLELNEVRIVRDSILRGTINSNLTDLYITNENGPSNGDIHLKPSGNGFVVIGENGLSMQGTTIASTGMTLDPGSGNVIVKNRLYLDYDASYNTSGSVIIDSGTSMKIKTENTLILNSGSGIVMDAIGIKNNGTASTLSSVGSLTINSGADMILTTPNANRVYISNASDAGSISTGAFDVAGGVGIGQRLYVGGEQFFTGITHVLSGSSSGSVNSGALQVSGGAGIVGNLYVGGVEHCAGILYADNGAGSANYGQGSIVVNGGIGISENVSVNGIIRNTSGIGSPFGVYTQGSIVTNGGVGISERLNVHGISRFDDICNIISVSQADNTSNGALRVGGGVGIGRNLHVGGSIYADSGVSSGNISQGSIIVDGGVGVSENVNIGGTLGVTGNSTFTTAKVTTLTNAGNTASGALQVSGGVGIGMALYVGGITYAVNNTETNGTDSGALIVSGGVGIGKGLHVGGITHVTNTSDTNGTDSGALIVSGGVGIALSVNIGDKCRIRDVSNTTSASTGALQVVGGVGIGGNMFIADQSQSTSSTTGALVVTGGIGVSGSIYVKDTVTIIATDLSINATTGALTVSGGIGVGGNIYINSNAISTSTSTGALRVIGGLGVAGSAHISNIHIIDTTSSSSSSIGALIVNGGCGLGEDLFVTKNTSTNTLKVIASTVAVNNTTGAIVVNGGIGCGGDIRCESGYVYSNNSKIYDTLYVDTISEELSSSGVSFTSNSRVYIRNTTAAGDVMSGALNVSGGVGVQGTLFANNIQSVTTVTAPQFIIPPGTFNSTSTSSGALIIGGGVGIGKTLYVSNVRIVSTDDSTDSTTGSLVITGGVGIGKQTHLYGDVFIHSATNAGNYPVGALAVEGGVNVHGTLKATAVISDDFTENISDRKFKTNIEYESVPGLSFIKKLKPCQYTRVGGQLKNFGLIAQELQEVLDDFDIKNSQMVVSRSDGLHVGYMNLMSILIKSVKELDEKVEKLNMEIIELKEKY